MCKKRLPYTRWTRCSQHWMPPRKSLVEWLAEWWAPPPSPAPATPQRASTAPPPHDVWLGDLLEELPTPENEGAFQRADLLHVLDQPTPAWMRGYLKPGD